VVAWFVIVPPVIFQSITVEQKTGFAEKKELVKRIQNTYNMNLNLTPGLLCLVSVFNQVTAQERDTQDFTAEKQFTHNIEGPAYDKKGNLFVVNFQKDGTIGKVEADGKCSLFAELPAGSTANAIRFTRKQTMLLADFTGHNVLELNPKTKKVSVYCHNDRFNQPNDLTINAQGQVFLSDPDWQNNTGQLWRIDTDKKAVLLEDSMGTTNGIELSPDGKILYVNESMQRNVWQYKVDEKGNVSNKKLLISFPDFGLDGMKCDKQGNLYITRYDKGSVTVLSPEGEIIREIKSKGLKVSNIALKPDGKSGVITLQDRGCLEKF
jgi:gluconolactonase